MTARRTLRIASLFKPAGHLRSQVWLVSLVLLLSSLALAQRDLGTITGTVTDPSGAAVPDAALQDAAFGHITTSSGNVTPRSLSGCISS